MTISDRSRSVSSRRVVSITANEQAMVEALDELCRRHAPSEYVERCDDEGAFPGGGVTGARRCGVGQA